jgi:N,N'-diacetylbacillosaminyl-diphospho-undecaprenol alpha-1,3-N-acetylgalactosaminyltransferase
MKIAFVIFDAQSAWLFHRTLFRMLKANGHEVHVFAGPDEFVNSLSDVVSEFHPVEESTRFIAPLMDLLYTKKLYRLFRQYKFDVVHNLHGKPNVFGGIAAFLAGVPRRYSSVQGRGLPFSKNASLALRLLLPVVKVLYSFSFWLSNRVWFLNSDDMRDFVEWCLVREDKAGLIRSVGVDIEEFSPDAVSIRDRDRIRSEWGVGSDTIVIGMAARLSWSKGVKEFFEAAQHVSDAHFILVGPCDDGPDRVPEEWLHSKTCERIKWLGFRRDIRECIAAMDILVLPSFYPEGVPRILLEGLAMGKPIITTDTPGCKEVVITGENGYLIPPRDGMALSKAIMDLIRDGTLRTRFCVRSRSLCEEERIIQELYN